MKRVTQSLGVFVATLLLAAGLGSGNGLLAQTPRGGHNGNGSNNSNNGSQPRGNNNNNNSGGGGNSGAQPRGQFNNGGNDNYNNRGNDNGNWNNNNNGNTAPPNQRGGTNPNNNGNTAPPNNRGQVHPRTGQPINTNNDAPSNSRGSYGNNGGQGNYYNDNNRAGTNPNYRPRDSYYQRYYRPNYQPTQPTTYYSTWHGPDRVWIPGHYTRNYYGQQVWVNGHWRVRRNGAYVVVYDPAPQYAPVYNPTMSTYEFGNAMNYLYSIPYEDTRMNVGQQMLSNHLFTSDQVRDIVMAYQFESNRLEIAKMAYLRTLDPQNFYVVYEAFQYESSVVRLDGYIASLWR